VTAAADPLHAEPVLLTDDEVIAVGACLGSSWPTPTPTVDQSDVDALLAAVGRGRRSLAVRGLLRAQGGDLGVLDEQVRVAVGESLAAGLVVSVQVTDAALRPLGMPPSYHHYGAVDDENWATDVVVPAGAHRIGQASRADCLRALAVVMEAVWTDGVGGAGEAELDGAEPWLCVLGGVVAGTGVPTRAVLVSRSELRRLDLDLADDGTVIGRPVAGPAATGEIPAWLGLRSA
jgi:hypothetical protein